MQKRRNGAWTERQRRQALELEREAREQQTLFDCEPTWLEPILARLAARRLPSGSALLIGRLAEALHK